jgi:hypothetical protein
MMRVYMSEFLERKQVGGVLAGIELVRGGLIDRHGHRRGRWIGAIASAMQDDGFRIFAFGGHEGSVLVQVIDRLGWAAAACQTRP